MKIFTLIDQVTEEKAEFVSKLSKHKVFYFNNKKLNYDTWLFFTSYIMNNNTFNFKNKKAKEELQKQYKDSTLEHRSLFWVNKSFLQSIFGKYYNYYVDYAIHIGLLSPLYQYQYNIKGKESDYNYNPRKTIYEINSVIGRLDYVTLNNKATINCYNRYIDKKEGDKIVFKTQDANLLKIYDKLLQSFNKLRVDWNKAYEIASNIELDEDDMKTLNIIYKNPSKDNINNLKDLKVRRSLFLLHYIDVGQIHPDFWLKSCDNNRLHTPLTIINKKFRECIILDDKTLLNRDITNSQPLLLSKLMVESDNYSDVSEFINLCLEGKIYEYLLEIINNLDSKVKFISKENKSGKMVRMYPDVFTRKDAKILFYQFAYGPSNMRIDPLAREVIKSDPMLMKVKKWCDNYKILGGSDNMLANDLQKIEGSLIFLNICNDIFHIDNEIDIFTIHDSVLYKPEDAKIVESIWDVNIEGVKREIKNKLK